jgi:hypothetical protein
MPHAKEERADVSVSPTRLYLPSIKGDYEMPWHHNSGMPMNIASGKVLPRRERPGTLGGG